MAINFDIPENLLSQIEMVKGVADYIMRPLSRELDENGLEAARRATYPMHDLEQLPAPLRWLPIRA